MRTTCIASRPLAGLPPAAAPGCLHHAQHKRPIAWPSRGQSRCDANLSGLHGCVCYHLVHKNFTCAGPGAGGAHQDPDHRALHARRRSTQTNLYTPSWMMPDSPLCLRSPTRWCDTNKSNCILSSMVLSLRSEKNCAAQPGENCHPPPKRDARLCAHPSRVGAQAPPLSPVRRTRRRRAAARRVRRRPRMRTRAEVRRQLERDLPRRAGWRRRRALRHPADVRARTAARFCTQAVAAPVVEWFLRSGLAAARGRPAARGGRRRARARVARKRLSVVRRGSMTPVGVPPTWTWRCTTRDGVALVSVDPSRPSRGRARRRPERATPPDVDIFGRDVGQPVMSFADQPLNKRLSIFRKSLRACEASSRSVQAIVGAARAAPERPRQPQRPRRQGAARAQRALCRLRAPGRRHGRVRRVPPAGAPELQARGRRGHDRVVAGARRTRARRHAPRRRHHRAQLHRVGQL